MITTTMKIPGIGLSDADRSNSGLHGLLQFSSDALKQKRRRLALDRLSWYCSATFLPAVWRIFEFCTALFVTLFLLPVMAALYLIANVRGGGILRTVRLGENAQEFKEFSFSFYRATDGVRVFPDRRGSTNHVVMLAVRIPALFNVLLGDMSLVGPRTLSRKDISFEDRSVWKRFGVRPGLIGLWWLRKQANIAYEREAAVDAEYTDRRSVQTDLGIILRSLPVAFYGSSIGETPRKIDILGIPVDNIGMDEAIEQILTHRSGQDATQVCFVNADCINIARRDADYAALLRNCALVLADGIGVKLASNLLKTPICQNVNGTDLVPRLCSRLAGQESGIYLLGGLPGVAEDVRCWIERTYPGLRVEGCQHGYFPEEETPSVIENIRASGAKVLLVAMGAPKQEKWIGDHAAAAGIPVSIGVGGLFDFYAGRIPRAPMWVREIGMEWLFRLGQEPGRMWKRYLVGNLVFAARVLWQRTNCIMSGAAKGR